MSILVDAFVEEFLTNFPEILLLGELLSTAACTGRGGAISYPVV
jgi:hypothetical protein